MSDPADQLHERLLVIRSQTGDERAFAELVARYHPRLSYYVSKMTSRPSAVDDLLQDTWLDILRALPTLRDAAAFPAWAYRIARARVYRDLRHRTARPPTASLESHDPPVDDAPADDAFSPDDVAFVHECLDDLTPDHREALVLRFLQSMTYEQIAAVADCDVGTVRSRLHYAKRALRDAIERKRTP